MTHKTTATIRAPRAKPRPVGKPRPRPTITTTMRRSMTARAC